MNIEKLIEAQNKLANDTAEAKQKLQALESNELSTLKQVGDLQKLKVKLLDLEIKSASNAIELCKAQQAEAPEQRERCQAEYDAALEEVTATLAEAGITIEEMPSAGIDAEAAKRQLVNGFVMTSSIVRASKAELDAILAFEKQSRDTLRTLNANLEKAQQAKASFFAKLAANI